MNSAINRVAFVTGAASGIGAAVTRRLVSDGAAVTAFDRDSVGLDHLAVELAGAAGRLAPVIGDVADPGDVKYGVDVAVETFGKLSWAVNCAGIASGSAPVAEVDPEDWDRTIAINLSGLFYGMRYEIPAILASGGGAIVNISSVFADRGQTMRPAYSAAKHGIRGLTRSAAVDYAEKGLRVNELQPGVVNTPMLGADQDRTDSFAQLIPAGRVGDPSEIAAAVRFLLSDDASYINGAHLAVDGAFLA
ncbi:SDR family NAD(P)-dependent oxidoreductase [Nocardia jiangxiensis]|uniref:SDR family NAD(P)-dependent oxidoreductase n=1 Tax=Nocardia jiangxiensis TaxID=282685 RepID=A0ABW6SFE2_9NOCA|nr:SDR family NAD(P)-dependent oxidoreductase [Nocardia jiangxiensis]